MRTTTWLEENLQFSATSQQENSQRRASYQKAPGVRMYSTMPRERQPVERQWWRPLGGNGSTSPEEPAGECGCNDNQLEAADGHRVVGGRRARGASALVGNRWCGAAGTRQLT